MFRRILFIGIVVVGALFLAIQLLPYGRQHANPPVTAEPQWPDVKMRELAVRACFDCHSNQTEWPWYAQVAPLSWVVQNHVEEARARLNFSEWDRPQEGRGEAAEVVQEGEMPPGYYTLMHRAARLSSAEKSELARGLGGLN